MKAFVASILILGLISPLCLCGEAVTESHAAVAEVSACQASHHHHHEGDPDEPEPGHSHSHSEVRLSVSNEIQVPAAAAFEWVHGWAGLLVFDEDSALPEMAVPGEGLMRPPPWEGTCRAVSGVFLI